MADPRRPLSQREIEVAALLVEGLSNGQIAVRLGVSERTVQSHVANAMGKLSARSRTHVAVLVLRAGIVALRPLDIDGPKAEPSGT